MKDRLITFALAIGAFVLFYALFVPKPAPENNVMALPTSTETRPDGYQALWRWLQGQHIPVVSFRERYEGLSKRSSSATGNVLLATLPQQLPTRPDEMQQLDKWIQSGNTLVVMAALDDTPKWALGAGEDFISALQRMTRLKFSTGGAAAKENSDSAAADQTSNASDDQDSDATNDAADGAQASDSDSAIEPTTAQSIQRAFEKLLNPERSNIEPNGSHPLMAGVQSVIALSEYPASRWRASSMDTAAVLVIGKNADNDPDQQVTDAVLWLKRQGEGQIIICAFATPFSNQLIGEADNARLFANIIAWSRSATGAVLFDDAHQGLVSYYDAKAFFADPRLHRTLLWIVLLWLLFVLGWQRLRPQFDHWHPADITTFIKVTGSFFAGSLTAATVGQRLFENFFNRLRRRLALPEDGQPVWEWLSTQAGISSNELHDLQRLHATTQLGRRVDLIQLQNRLTTLIRHLA